MSWELCAVCGGEILDEVDRDCEAVCAKCVIGLCEDPKAKEMAYVKTKEAEARNRGKGVR